MSTSPRKHSGFLWVALVVLLVSATTMQVVVEGKLQRPVMKPGVNWIQCHLGGHLLDSRRAVLRRYQAVGRPEEELRPAVSAARHHHLARPALQHRLQIRVDSPVRGVSERAWQQRTGDHAAAEGYA